MRNRRNQEHNLSANMHRSQIEQKSNIKAEEIHIAF